MPRDRPSSTQVLSAHVRFSHGAAAAYRPDLTIGTPWILGRGRFLVVAITTGDARIGGTVFEVEDGRRFTFTAVQTRDEAEAARKRGGGDACICAVRPSFSFPAA